MAMNSLFRTVCSKAAVWSGAWPVGQVLPPTAAASSVLARLQPPLAPSAPQTDQRRSMAYVPRMGPQRWPRYNEKVYEPTAPEEPQRPAYICHVLTNVKYSKKKMWYVASMIRGMSVHEALKQLQFVNLKGSKIATQAIQEAQELAVRDHNVEFKNNLWVAESFATKAKVVKGLRRCARGKMSVVRYGYIHYFLRLEEGAPPAQYYLDAPKPPEQMLEQWLQQRRDRIIQHSL